MNGFLISEKIVDDKQSLTVNHSKDVCLCEILNMIKKFYP